MFGMGLTIKMDDFKRVFSKPKEIVIGFVAQYTIMPVVAWGLCQLMHLPTDLALGVILVGCCPGGTASNVITYIAGGDVALSVGMTITSTLAAPLMTPLLVYLLAGAWVEVSFLAMVISVVKVVLIPVLLGILINRAYFGQKDAQQLAIIRKMVQDLNFDIQIVGCPIIREEDGLAKSSRNTYLSEEERKAALCLSRAVKAGQNMICKGSKAEEVLTKMREIIEAEPLAKIDYVSMVDALDMQPVEIVEKDVLVAMAVYIGKTRLIDNFSYEV